MLKRSCLVTCVDSTRVNAAGSVGHGVRKRCPAQRSLIGCESSLGSIFIVGDKCLRLFKRRCLGNIAPTEIRAKHVRCHAHECWLLLCAETVPVESDYGLVAFKSNVLRPP